MPPESAPRKVSLILHKFSRGGSDRVAAYLARGFVDAGLQVELLVFCKGGEVEETLTGLLGAGIPVRYLGTTGASRALDLIRGLPGLIRRLREDRPDVVISTANNTALISAVALRLAGASATKLVLKTTNPVATSRHTGVVRWLRLATYRLIFRWTASVWTLSAEESAEMRAEFPRYAPLFRDVANPYVTEAMLRPRPPAPFHAGKTMISVARLTAQKRLDLLIAAFAHVRDRRARLLILGEGEDRVALTEQIADLGLTGRVTMPGYVNDVGKALAAADLFVLPSDYEGLPAAVLEAMAVDCPVLSTDCFPAARSLVGGTPGCAIIEQTDPEHLAALIDDYLTRPKPDHLRAVAERYSIANGITSHLRALAEQ